MAYLVKSDPRVDYYCWDIYRKDNMESRLLLGEEDF